MAGCWSTLKKWKTRNLLTIEKLKLVKIVKMVLKEIFISALLGLLVSNIAFAKEKAMPIDSGRIIASGYGLGKYGLSRRMRWTGYSTSMQQL